MVIVERRIFDNGGYQVRVCKDKVFVDVSRDGKCFSKEKTIIEFYTWKLKKHCKELIDEIERVKDGLR